MSVFCHLLFWSRLALCYIKKHLNHISDLSCNFILVGPNTTLNPNESLTDSVNKSKNTFLPCFDKSLSSLTVPRNQKLCNTSAMLYQVSCKASSLHQKSQKIVDKIGTIRIKINLYKSIIYPVILICVKGNYSCWCFASSINGSWKLQWNMYKRKKFLDFCKDVGRDTYFQWAFWTTIQVKLTIAVGLSSSYRCNDHNDKLVQQQRYNCI